MTKNTHKSIFEVSQNSVKEQKTREWQIAFAEYIERSNQLLDESGSALDEWCLFR
jgi:post-segregation antitoxin (ccd killing protein)